ncbi:MAG TPA: hypothetical protein VF322_11570 [Gammaproteobacteria bacterium]
MKAQTMDRHLYTQIGLDSGSLTMLGAVVKSFGEPGEYRGTVRKGDRHAGVFYLSVDKDSPVARADIDLAAFDRGASAAGSGGCGCGEPRCGCGGKEPRYSVNPRGYALFRVSGGAGGYAVHVRKAAEADDTPVFDSRKLGEGAVFSAMLLRPGRYAVTNTLGKARAEVVVAYPQRTDRPYRPPAPVRVTVTAKGFDQDGIRLGPAQGLIFECRTEARIKIELVEPDDGPRGRDRRRRTARKPR